jgi:hypothetical protein
MALYVMSSLGALEFNGQLAGLDCRRKQISLTDPDARAMTSKSHSVYTVGYNVQSAVDTKHPLNCDSRGHQRRHRQRPTVADGGEGT